MDRRKVSHVFLQCGIDEGGLRSAMDSVFSLMPPALFAAALGIALLAGLIKGVVGFAMPMVMISGMGSFMAPELALAGLILPTLVTNGMQALRQGAALAWASIKRFRLFLAIGMVMLVASAQLVTVLPAQVMLLIIGVPVTLFALMQIFGWQLSLAGPRRGAELAIGAFAGAIGGVSGVWGPPTVAYLTAIGTPKREQMRIQGVIYGLGAVVLFAAHLQSGVMRGETVPFSAALIVPAVIGMWLGTKVQDRIDQAVFRKATLWVLLLAGANLIRRALIG